MTGLVLVLGIASEPPIAAVTRELSALRVPHVLVDQQHLLSGDAETWWDDGNAGGMLSVNEERVPLDDVTAVYTRLTSWAELPQVGGSDNPGLLDRARDLHIALESWLETTPALVVNRTSANDTNNSKPYQSLLIRNYFEIPTTLVTTDPEAALAFREEFGRVIYKSLSGERSIVTAFREADIKRLSLLANAPVQFQEHVAGLDVRVHVVGPEVIATAVETHDVDYRYDGGHARMAAFALPDSVSAACQDLTARLGLQLSGIDLRFADDGRVVCFEVNPSPAYTAYEEATGQPIAATLATHLATPARRAVP